MLAKNKKFPKLNYHVFSTGYKIIKHKLITC